MSTVYDKTLKKKKKGLDVTLLWLRPPFPLYTVLNSPSLSWIQVKLPGNGKAGEVVRSDREH